MVGLVVVFGLLASGRANANPKVTPSLKTGTLIVYRKWNLVGSGGSYPFSVNDGPVIKLRNGYYYKMELPEGDYTLRERFWYGPSDPQKVHVTAGQTIYFSYSAAPRCGKSLRLPMTKLMPVKPLVI